MSKSLLFNKADLQLEVVILIIAGLIVSITGILLFPVATGSLPYYENGLYGLLLVMFALQIVSLGKTPFGDMKRTWLLIAAGVIVAAVGIVTCFVPDIFSETPRLLLMLFFGPGGFLLFMQMILSRDRLMNWLKYGGIFRHLIAGCSLVYLLSMVIALLLLNRNLLTTQVTAAVVLTYGVSIIYLALVLRKIYLAYPQAEKRGGESVDLPMDRAIILLIGVFMVLLGLLLIPVNLGMLPFSGSAQLGLLMVFFSVQMLASGSTPIGPFPRTWLMVLFGLLFASLGTVSCVIPEILVFPLTILIGILNILGGLLNLGKFVFQSLKGREKPRASLPPIVHILVLTQLVLSLLSIVFGTSMLISSLLPGLVIGIVLTANGVVLLYLLYILSVIDRMSKTMENTR
ncbi:MAG TPA: hypothetical protein PK411_13750 [Mesotoga infera]|jgi:hypothetical protein|nr:hypothetical protein [Thermotogaceae bacterium]HNS66675.1 hypothetical protein [Mesotoga infera]HRR45351.1 hypothetical protein [Mesotoga sp.]HOI35551.1 hypothetical protein [Mesotoga infera]HON29150.1 hypothetical protein [Mesotoga infera]